MDKKMPMWIQLTAFIISVSSSIAAFMSFTELSNDDKLFYSVVMSCIFIIIIVVIYYIYSYFHNKYERQTYKSLKRSVALYRLSNIRRNSPLNGLSIGFGSICVGIYYYLASEIYGLFFDYVNFYLTGIGRAFFLLLAMGSIVKAVITFNIIRKPTDVIKKNIEKSIIKQLRALGAPDNDPENRKNEISYRKNRIEHGDPLYGLNGLKMKYRDGYIKRKFKALLN